MYNIVTHIDWFILVDNTELSTL